jgi:hypothetical protein
VTFKTIKQYGRLKILRMLKGSRVIAACSCGSEPREYSLYHLKDGHTSSCGCLQREKAAAAGRLRRKHGHSLPASGEYLAWQNMKLRCYGVNAPRFKTYGARGVRVCSRWLDPIRGFQNFLADVGLKPTPKHTLSRIADFGDYGPGSNVAWATWAEQGQQRRLRNQRLAA